MDLKQEIAKLERLKVGALFMEMGTGKTKIALDLMKSRLQAGKCDRLMWIAPVSLQATMEHERDKWQPDLEIGFYGCEGIAGSQRIYAAALEYVQGGRTFIVVDESLRIKNPESNTAKRLIAIGRYAKYKLVLNGTPLSRNVLDIWAQMEFLSPLILKLTYRQFKDNYCKYDTKGQYIGRVREQCNIAHLTSLIAPYIVEARLSLDTVKRHKYLYYPQDDRDGYERLKHDLRERLAKDISEYGHASLASFMALTSKLQHHYCRSSGRQVLIDYIIRTVDEPVIIFTRWRSSIPDDVPHIDGDTPLRKRDELIQSFTHGEIKALYIMLGCGAFGLNLQACHHVIFSEQTWDYAQQLQAEARVYRTGQTEDCHYYHLLCRGPGLEDMIRINIERKGSFSEAMKSEITQAKHRSRRKRMDRIIKDM